MGGSLPNHLPTKMADLPKLVKGGTPMPDLREFAWKITTALHGCTATEPLVVELWNHSPGTAAYLIELVIEECAGAGVTLSKIRVDPYVGVVLREASARTGLLDRGVHLEIGADLLQRAEFYPAVFQPPSIPGARHNYS